MSATRSNRISWIIVPDSESRDNVVDDPSWVVSRQPSENRGFVDEIVCGGCWRCLESLLREKTDSVPRIVRTDIVDRGINHLHPGQAWNLVLYECVQYNLAQASTV
jgi:hypothetical protein